MSGFQRPDLPLKAALRDWATAQARFQMSELIAIADIQTAPRYNQLRKKAGLPVATEDAGD
jgi:hypothetical protein